MAGYRGIGKILSGYWKDYGGLKALVRSPYLHVSIVISFFAYPSIVGDTWVDSAQTIVPNLLGFSLGGYAMLLAFSNEKFLLVLSKASTSPLLALSASFVHFIVLQILVLIVAIVFESSPISRLPNEWKIWLVENIPYIKLAYFVFSKVMSALGMVLFVYSLMAALAATMAIYRVYTWYGRYLKNALKASEKTNSVEQLEQQSVEVVHHLDEDGRVKKISLTLPVDVGVSKND